jgi:hypothetical protein
LTVGIVEVGQTTQHSNSSVANLKLLMDQYSDVLDMKEGGDATCEKGELSCTSTFQ